MFRRKKVEDLTSCVQVSAVDPGPQPDDIDPGPTRPFLVVRREGMASLVVMGHGTDFGTEELSYNSQGTRRPGGIARFTRVWMSGVTTHYLGTEYVGLEKPRIPVWYPEQNRTDVFVARTEDVVMIVDKNNLKSEPEQQQWSSSPSSPASSP